MASPLDNVLETMRFSLLSCEENANLNHTTEDLLDSPGFLFCFVLFIFYYMHTLFGSFLHPVPLPHRSPPSSVSGRSRSAFVTDFVEEKT
jgi:hypothetical protein